MNNAIFYIAMLRKSADGIDSIGPMRSAPVNI